jgi:ubiquitin carboxyl-terminal hydrolase 9/24
MQAKFVQNNVTNSPDSSEESSGGSPNHFTGGMDGPNTEAEESLPSVMISMDEKRMAFLAQLSGLGASIGEDRLRDGARMLLQVMPRCRNTEKALQEAFIPTSTITDKKPYNLLFNQEPAVVLYRLEVLYTMLFPSSPLGNQMSLDLLPKFFVSGGASMVVEMLTKNNFMPLADVATKRSAYLAVLKLTKAVLTVTSSLVLKIENELPSHEERVNILQEAWKVVPNPSFEFTLRLIADHVAKTLHAYLKQNPESQSPIRGFVNSAISGTLPDLETIRLLMRLASSTASGSLAYFATDQHHGNREPVDDDVAGNNKQNPLLLKNII